MNAITYRFLFILIATALAGCDAVEREQAAFTEKLLADAGFQRVPALGAASEDLAGIPPREIVARSPGGRMVYLYSNIEDCRCLNEEIARAMTWNDY